MAHLTIHQNLTTIQNQYEAVVQRPVYISGYLKRETQALYYFNYLISSSEKEEYAVQQFLSIYLSPFSFPFVRRELDETNQRDRKDDYELRRFCYPELPREVSFCFPLSEQERLEWKKYVPASKLQEEFSQKLNCSGVWLRGGYSEVSVIPSYVEEHFPELVPYIYAQKEIENPHDFLITKKAKINNPSPDFNSNYCLAFAHSWPFEVPQEKQISWEYYESSQADSSRYHIIDPEVEFPIYTSLCPPGQYKSKTERLVDYYSKDLCFPVVFCQKPKRCIICAGAQNDRRHIAFSKEQIEQHIYQCYTCFQSSIKDWSSLLEKIEEYEPKQINRRY